MKKLWEKLIIIMVILATATVACAPILESVNNKFVEQEVQSMESVTEIPEGCWRTCDISATINGEEVFGKKFNVTGQSTLESCISIEEEFVLSGDGDMTMVEGICGYFNNQDDNNCWWMIYVDGEMAPTGVHNINIVDGAKYEFRYEQF